MATFIGFRDGGKTNEEGLHKELNRLFTAGNPITVTPSSMQVVQRGAGANMSVDISIGDVHLINPAGTYSYWGWTDAATNAVITTSDPTNPRIDVICAYLDLTVVSSSSNNNPGALKFYVATGTPAGTPVAMTDAAIQTALGSTTPFIRLATVSVVAASSTVTNAVITDARTNITMKVPTSSTISSGYTTLLNTPTTITDNANRSYTCVFNGVDLSGTLAPGYRLRTTRSVAAPTQSTSLNGTTQYWSRASASLGTSMTFTNFPVATAWIKLTAYNVADSIIQGRHDGTNGWLMGISATGQLYLSGYNGAVGNFNRVLSSQLIPLNKWVHVAAQLDMSTSTLDSTHSWVTIDGVNVAATKVTGGTAPTSLVQGTGAYQVGAFNGATSTFSGKIAQVSLYSAAVSQATIIATRNQTVPSTATSLISSYDFSGNANDLNTSNANNLTTNGSAGYTADGPFGGQGNGTISSTLDYGIIQSVTFSTNTTVVVQVAEGCTIPTTGGVSALSYSNVKNPFGFPGQVGKWCLEFQSATSLSTTTTASVWVNPNTYLNVPVGEWLISYQASAFVGSTGTSFMIVYATIGTSTSTSIRAFQSAAPSINSSLTQQLGEVTKQYPYSQTTQANLYLNATHNVGGTTNLGFEGTVTTTILTAQNAWL